MTRSRLAIEVSTRGSTVLVHPKGTLDLSSTAALRTALLKCVADGPSGVIICMDHLDVRSQVGLSLFAAVARRAAEWPGVPVGLVTGPALRNLVRHGAISRFVPVFDSVEEALAGVNGPPARQLATLYLPASPTSSRLARRFVAATCERWGIHEATADAVMVASELAENAAQHARSDASLRVELRCGILTVALRDNSPVHPTRREPDLHTFGGRGIQMMARVARVWGCSPTWTGGKVIWAVLPLRQQAAQYG